MRAAVFTFWTRRQKSRDTMTATPIVVAPGPNARHRARERACELGLECGPLVEFEVYQTSTPKPLELELDVCSKPRVAP